ncbi:MAG TPA: hypothetical protein VH640_31950, partial [Bryobacteraceae bacterium]
MTVTIKLFARRALNASLLVALGIIGALPLPSAPAGRILWERPNGPSYSRVLLYEPSDLTQPNMRSLYKVLSRELGGKVFWTVSVFTEEGDATREIYGKMTTEVDYDRWLGLYNKYGRNLLPMAQISAYKDNAVLRFRDSKGISTETVLSGNNFLRVHLDNLECEILETYFHDLPPHTKPSQSDEAMVSIYVRTSRYPGTAEARKFSQVMQARIQQKRIIISFRTDSYFLVESGFPII